MLTKDAIYQTMEKLSHTFSLDELIERLVFVEKVEKGLQQSNEGLVYNHSEAQEKLSKWLR